jgi:hypothetical protein
MTTPPDFTPIDGFLFRSQTQAEREKRGCASISTRNGIGEVFLLSEYYEVRGLDDYFIPAGATEQPWLLSKDTHAVGTPALTLTHGKFICTYRISSYF